MNAMNDRDVLCRAAEIIHRINQPSSIQIAGGEPRLRRTNVSYTSIAYTMVEETLTHLVDELDVYAERERLGYYDED